MAGAPGPWCIRTLKVPEQAVFAEALSAALSCFNTSNTPHRSSRHSVKAHTVREVWDVSVGQAMEVKRSLLTWTHLALLSLWFFRRPYPKSFGAGASLGLTDAEEPSPCRNDVPLAAEEVECLPSILKAWIHT